MFTKTKVEDVEITTQIKQNGLSDNNKGQTRTLLYALALAVIYNFTNTI